MAKLWFVKLGMEYIGYAMAEYQKFLVFRGSNSGNEGREAWWGVVKRI